MEYIAIFAQRLTEPLVSLGETYPCPQDVNEAAYKRHPVLEYNSYVWDPQGVVLQVELESVQKRTARFVTGNHTTLKLAA